MDTTSAAVKAQAERRAACRLIREGVAAGTNPEVAGITAAFTFPGVPVNYLRNHIALHYGAKAPHWES